MPETDHSSHKRSRPVNNHVRLGFTLGGQTPRSFYVVKLHGREYVSELYEFTVYIAHTQAERLADSSPAGLSAEDAIGQRAALTIDDTRAKTRRRFDGVICAFCPVNGSQSRMALYRLTLRPPVWPMTLRYNRRVFQAKQTHEIAQELLDSYFGSEGDARTYETHLHTGSIFRDYCTQYDENDWAFLSRILAEDGIYCLFHTTENAPILSLRQGYPSAPRVVFGTGAAIRYVPPSMTEASNEHVFAFGHQDAMQATKVTVSAHAEDNLSLRQAAAASVSSKAQYGQRPALNSECEVEETGGTGQATGGYAERYLAIQLNAPDMEDDSRPYTRSASQLGARVASDVAEAVAHRLALARRKYLGGSTSIGLHAGYVFKLDDRARSGDYLLLGVWHEAGSHLEEADTQTERYWYRNRFECVKGSEIVEYQPPLLPRPQITTPQLARVVGSSDGAVSQEERASARVSTVLDRQNITGLPGDIHTDKEGRVRIQFHWDGRTKEGDCSCWVRVTQAWAGPSWGSQFIPRVGQTVIVMFVEGNPDMPLVMGSVFGPNHLPPYPGPSSTQSGIKTRSSPANADAASDESVGFNELRFDDKKGEEEVFIHAQRDLNEEVLRNQSTTVGVDQGIAVGQNQHITVGANQIIGVRGLVSETVDGAVDEKYNDTRTTLVRASETLRVEGPRRVTVREGDDVLSVETGKHLVNVKGDQVTTVISGAVITTAQEGHIVTTACKGNLTLGASAGNAVLRADQGSGSIHSAQTLSLHSGSKVHIAVAGSEVIVDASGVTVRGPDAVVVQGAQIAVEGKQVSVKGDQVKIDGTSAILLNS